MTSFHKDRNNALLIERIKDLWETFFFENKEIFIAENFGIFRKFSLAFQDNTERRTAFNKSNSQVRIIRKYGSASH